MEPEPVLEVSETETVKELMGKLEERVMREVLCWCMRHGIRPTERVRALMAPGSALHTRPEVRASRLVKTVPASPGLLCTYLALHILCQLSATVLLAVLTMAGVVLVRHRVMRWNARCPQYARLARYATSQLLTSPGLG